MRTITKVATTLVLTSGMLIGGLSLKAATSTSTAQAATAKVINWRKPSQNKAYPSFKTHKGTWLYVSTKRQRVYFHYKNKITYIMNCSTGKTSTPTPKGTYHIQAEHGLRFGGPLGGARYYVSWKGHGTYLFHSVPINGKGQYITSEAKKLGHKASHGCIRLAIPDAKWLYTHVPVGTKVVIH
ncbi:hypothetical protein AYR62_00930 [Secundilactobacillus paracollinoides]|uniref:L,D-TPase catalytic domain-containing protein n=1 Tax=Secundilactobacillus paracollinoides TaxID=240427 RepID=A0A1B2IVD7_9LACO|nr:L,D-transpeptidase [Secundilactobacillus paracollinoides]ANZ60241.1 hypothetical protein AYR61_01985 [Secundilactobacillus paracollinoides]ANZ62803.1 hypothetical protein AYR62_00930 [Secundilactobacillus paracollinoides]ANZ66036.1 hypothetical protein AYR63_02005 [Secundilactobacillus paracollinoides]